MKDLITGVAALVGIPEDKATAFLAELSKRADAVAWMQISVEEGVDTKVPRSNKPGKFNPEWWKFEPLFTFPPIHDIEAIENRVAEACAKFVDKRHLNALDAIRLANKETGEHIQIRREARSGESADIAEAIRSGEWRKYK